MVVLCLVAAMLTGCGGNNKINALDYVELGQYKDLPVTKMSTAVSEEDIDLQIMRLASAGATTEKITDRDVVQEGDVANIDYVGSNISLIGNLRISIYKSTKSLEFLVSKIK